MTIEFTDDLKRNLNDDIAQFPQVEPINHDMHITREGVGQLVMLDRYAFKDTEKRTLQAGDFVVVTVRDDPQFPARGLGFVRAIEGDTVTVEVAPEYGGQTIERPVSAIDKPLEIYYEQIARRVARGLASVEAPDKQAEVEAQFYREIMSDNFVPAGRVLYGAGSGTDVTYFNCYVMPFPKDSREGIAEHRGKVMEIMSRGGGKLSC